MHTPVGVTRCIVIKSACLYNYGGKTGAMDSSLVPYYTFMYKTYVWPHNPSSDTISCSSTTNRAHSRWTRTSKDAAETPRRAVRRPGPLQRWIHLVDDRHLAKTKNFSWLFPTALVKIREVDVLTDTQGKIYWVCNKFNRSFIQGCERVQSILHFMSIS